MNHNKYYLAAQARGFYDTPFLKDDGEKPVWWDLFRWYKNNIFDQDNTTSGELLEDLFDTLDKRISYLQGVFGDYSGSEIKKGGNIIHFANSSKKVERCKDWLNEIAREKLPKETFGVGVLKHEITYLTPICHKLTIDTKLVEFIKNYES